MRKSIVITICALIFLQLYFPIAYAIDNPDYVEDIGPGQRFMVKYEIRRKTRIDMEVEVISGGNLDIDVYIIDSENYNSLIQGFYFSYVKYYQRVVSASITFTFEENGDYWFIFDNTFSIITTKRVEIKFDTYYIGVDNNLITILIIGGILLVVGIVITIAIVKKSKKTLTQQQNIIIQKGELKNGLRFCSSCGQKIKKESAFCEFCGSKS